MPRKLSVTVAILGCALFVSSRSTPGSTAQIESKTGLVQIAVIDPGGRPITQAAIQFQSQPDGTLQEFFADESGRLSVDLRPSYYSVLISRPGFRHEIRLIAVKASSRQLLSVELKVGIGDPAIVADLTYGALEAADIGTVEFEVKDTIGSWIDGARIDFRGLPDGPRVTSLMAYYGKVTVRLPQGIYEVKIVKPGFNSQIGRVEVPGGETRAFDVVMDIAEQDCRPGVICDPYVSSDNMDIEPETAQMPELAGGCSEHEKIAEIRPSDAAYSYARELERSLNVRGIMVRCMCASKLTEIFRGQAGAAWFRTDDGAFDVLFLPKGRTFAGVKIVQRRESGGYRTSFSGRPQSAVRFDGSTPTYYVKRANMLFSAGGDEKLAALLESKLPR